MVKVITYGTYDLLHYGHIRLLERAKALGDYLIVGVTSDSFDLTRGKINAQQSLMERIESVRATGLADEIIVEEYEGQKIDDIKRYGVDIFTVGSDWKGKFDYLNEYCKVVYLDRTPGISSSEIRAEKRTLRIGLLGKESFLGKIVRESRFVNGLEVVAVCTNQDNYAFFSDNFKQLNTITSDYESMLKVVDAIYIISRPQNHYCQIKKALEYGKHVLCESPIVLKTSEFDELQKIANENNCILMEAIRTAYSTAFNRMIVLAKSGAIGDIVSVDCSCTSLRDLDATKEDYDLLWNSICTWAPCSLLPVFHLLGTEFRQKQIISHILDEETMYDDFTKITMVYNNAVASIKVGKGVKTEGELIISGTNGYIFVPSPWWKTEYFEVRKEDSSFNKRYFYQLDGEGIRFELVSFLKAIQTGKNYSYISSIVSKNIIRLLEEYYSGSEVCRIYY